jgi:hypothetical protein
LRLYGNPAFIIVFIRPRKVQWNNESAGHRLTYPVRTHHRWECNRRCSCPNEQCLFNRSLCYCVMQTNERSGMQNRRIIHGFLVLLSFSILWCETNNHEIFYLSGLHLPCYLSSFDSGLITMTSSQMMHRVGVFCEVLWLRVGRDSAVGIATRYGLDGPRIESRLGRDFPYPSRPALGPTQRTTKWE